MNKVFLKLERMPNVPIPLTLLASMGGVPKATLRNWKRKGWIRTYKERGCGDMVIVDEMLRLEDEGRIVIE